MHKILILPIPQQFLHEEVDGSYKYEKAMTESLGYFCGSQSPECARDFHEYPARNPCFHLIQFVYINRAQAKMIMTQSKAL